MAEDLFLQLLSKHSASRLRELRAEADEKIRQGELERDYITRALESKGAVEPTQPVRAHSAPGRKTGAAGGGSSREPIRKIVASEPGRTWMPSQVRDELARRFEMNVKATTVRAAMKRLLDEGVFARPNDGPNGFKLASTNGSGGEPHVEATSSGPNGYERKDALAQ